MSVLKLVNPNPFGTRFRDYFGISAKISGSFAIVGAPNEDDASGNDSGKAYIYNVTTGALVHTLNNPNAYTINSGDVNDRFGYSVAIHDNFCIVGAPSENDSTAIDSGKAYIFNVTTGALIYTLDNPNPSNNFFGSSVAIHGNFCIVGASYSNIASPVSSISDEGRAYIFNITTGNLIHTLIGPNVGIEASTFGWSVAIYDNYCAIGEPQASDFGKFNIGKVYIYNVQTGNLIYTLFDQNLVQNSYFGFSVAINNNRCVVGVPIEFISVSVPPNVGIFMSGGTGRPSVYIFDLMTGQVIQKISSTPFETAFGNSRFGYSVDIEDNYFIASSPYEREVDAESGTVYIFPLTNLTLNSNISFNAIQNEYGGVNPISITEYYSGGPYVSAGTRGVDGLIPAAGQISLGQFRNSYTSNVLSVLQTINVAGGSGAGSQIVLGAKYAIATPTNIDAIAPRVEVDPFTGIVSWPSSASRVDMENWFDDIITFNDPMTITVFGENYNSIPRLTLVASGSGTPTIRGDNSYRLDVTGLSSTTNLLVFARCTKYVGLGATTSNSVEFLCEDDTTVFYKIYATGVSGDYFIDGNISQIQKNTNWIWRLSLTKNNSHGQVITSPINNPYVCLNPFKGPVTTTFVFGQSYSALTAGGVKVNGTSVTIGMFTMFTNFTGDPFDRTFTRAQFNNYLLLIP